MKSGKISIPGVILVVLLIGGLGVGASRSGGTFFGGNSYNSSTGENGAIQCRVSGCNGELCVRHDIAVDSSCEWQPSFACYSQEYTECVAVSETECGWRPTAELSACLNGELGTLDATNRVTSFEECVAAGNAVMESYPRKCRHKGQTFVEQI